MKIISTLLFLIAIVIHSSAQDKAGVERACLDYLEGFYEGDTVKIARSFKHTLYKIGYWKGKDASAYAFDGQMTYQQAIKYAMNVKAKGNFAKPDAPKKVEVLDVMDQIASAKITAWWGVDYLLLSKSDNKWLIEEVLWQGPLKK